jgi:hypothetical protein
LAFFTRNAALLAEKRSQHWFAKKIAIFLTENWSKSPKKDCNIGPRYLQAKFFATGLNTDGAVQQNDGEGKTGIHLVEKTRSRQ